MLYSQNLHRTNEISRTTTYSGTDISIIAYRSQLDHEALDKINDFHRQIKESEQAEKELKKEVLFEEGQYSNLTKPPGYLESIQDWFSSKEDSDLKAQNREFDAFTAEAGRSFNARKLNEAYLHNIELKKQLVEYTSNLTTQFILGSIHTISYSSFREKFAMRTLGRVQAKGYTAGPRTIAGTMVFNVLQEHELLKLGIRQNENTKGMHPYSVMLDQIAPFDLLFIFANEFGSYSTMSLFDVTLTSEGQSMSVDQAITRNEMNFYAREMLPMRPIGNAFESFSQMIDTSIAEVTTNSTAIMDYSSSYKATARIDSHLNMDTIEQMRAESRGLF